MDSYIQLLEGLNEANRPLCSCGSSLQGQGCASGCSGGCGCNKASPDARLAGLGEDPAVGGTVAYLVAVGGLLLAFSSARKRSKKSKRSLHLVVPGR